MGFSTDFGLGTLVSNASNLWGTGASLSRRRERDRQSRAEWDSAFERSQLGPDMLARVEAAKAAGIHPLLAFGGSMSGGSVGGGGFLEGGGSPRPEFNFSRDVPVDPNQERYNKARADLAELDVKAAELRLAQQAGNQGGSAQTGQWSVQPAQITSVSRNIPFQQAGPPAASEQPFNVRNPYTGETQVGNLPSSDVGEKIENMGEFWQAILMTPMAGRFLWDTMVPDTGKAKLFDFLDWIGGKWSRKPDYRDDPAYREWLRSGRR